MEFSVETGKDTSIGNEIGGIPFSSVEEIKNPSKEMESRPIVRAEDVAFKITTLESKKTFSCVIEAFLKDSNAYGNVYFSRYFEWQGVCREKWFSECVYENMFALDGILITKSAHIDYHHETLPFQKIKASLNTKNVRFTSFDIVITFATFTNVLIASGYQKIVFADKNRKLSKIPQIILEKINEYQVE